MNFFYHLNLKIWAPFRVNPRKEETRGGIHQSFLDEKLEMISSLDFLQFTIHNHDSDKSTTQRHDPEILTESCFVWQEF